MPILVIYTGSGIRLASHLSFACTVMISEKLVE